VDLVDEELLKSMKKSGCYMAMFGIESGSQKILDMLCKGITIEQIKRGTAFCKKTGIQTAGYFMVGNPGETQDDVRKTLSLAKELGLDFLTFGITAAYPGTEFYAWAVNHKTLPDRFWYMRKDSSQSSSIRETSGNLDLPDFHPEQQAKMVKQANREFYLQFSYILKSILRLRSFSDIKRAIKAARELL
jgi:radical SAM superfamily enzyme YgiQ (UPF0313 family)